MYNVNVFGPVRLNLVTGHLLFYVCSLYVSVEKKVKSIEVRWGIIKICGKKRDCHVNRTNRTNLIRQLTEEQRKLKNITIGPKFRIVKVK